MEFFIQDEQAMLELGNLISKSLHGGDLVLLDGHLGAGKTTLVRGILHGLGWKEPVRSPTYNLFAPYDTDPPVLHADFYRISDAQGTGIEDYFDSHVCLIEWPDALRSLVDLTLSSRVEITTEGTGRRVRLSNILL